VYAIAAENPRPEQERHIHLLSYIWNLATRGGKAQFMRAVTVETPQSGQARHTHFQLPRKPRDVGRQGTLIYVITMETWRLYMPVYYNFVVVPAVIVKTQIMCVYVYNTVVLVHSDPLRS
jgi:hypothetical protein